MLLEPVVHEIKVSRADLMGDLKNPDKRAAYLDVGGQCWHVLGRNAKGKPIAEPEEVPIERGVLLANSDRMEVLRGAPKRAVENLPFGVWMSLAKASVNRLSLGAEDVAQALLLPVAHLEVWFRTELWYPASTSSFHGRFLFQRRIDECPR